MTEVEARECKATHPVDLALGGTLLALCLVPIGTPAVRTPALLLAGALFDGDRLSFQTERFLLDQMRRLEHHGVTVVYATGNHDPGSPLSGPRPLDWPPNVHVAWDATPKRILVHDREGGPAGYVSAAGHASDQEKRDLSRLLPAS